MLHLLAQAGQSANEVLEIVKNVHEFYYDAWTSLLWVVGVAAAVLLGWIGILQPWWTERSRRQTFAFDRDALLKQIQDVKSEIRREMEEAETMFKENLQQTLQRISESEEEAKRRLYQTRAEMCAVQARTAALAGDHVMAMQCEIVAAHYGCEANMSPLWWYHRLKALVECLQDTSMRGSIESDNEAVKILARVAAELEGTESGKECEEFLDKIKEFLSSRKATGSESEQET